MGRKIYPISRVSVEDTKIELNCRALKCVLLYMEDNYGREELKEFLCKTKMNLDYLENPHNWVSFDYFCRLLKALVEFTGNPNSPFDAGIYTCKKKTFGILSDIVSRLGSPGSMYKFTVEVQHRYAKMDDFFISELKRNSCVIGIRMHEGYKQSKNNCLNLQGTFASIPLIWKLPPATVEEIQCAVSGGDTCTYKITWINRFTRRYSLIGLFFGLGFMLLFKFFMSESQTYFICAVPLLSYFLGRVIDYKSMLKESIETNEKENKNLLESVETIEKLNIDLQGKIEKRTEELNDRNAELKNTLTKLKNSQSQLIQSEKMASVGRLAAGMAHELNNPVGAMRNYLQDFLEDTPKDDPKWKQLKNAEKATWRCRKIVDDLLTFARENKKTELIDLDEAVNFTIQNVKEEIGDRKIILSADLSGSLPKVQADSLQIKQVLMNLIMNAVDALEGEGNISLKTFRKNGQICIEVSDTGHGVPEDIQDKIFDPFFSTKAPGQGTGLGLAISYNIIKRFNGDLRLKNKPGGGTTFMITLPIKEKKA